MRCDEVIRELAVPTDDRDSAALAEHLASCPSCAGWAKRAAAIRSSLGGDPTDRTSPEVWDAVWARMASSLDSSTPAEVEAFALPMASSNGSIGQRRRRRSCRPVRRLASRPWSWAAIGLIGLAQAAAVFSPSD